MDGRHMARQIARHRCPYHWHTKGDHWYKNMSDIGSTRRSDEADDLDTVEVESSYDEETANRTKI